MLRSRIACLAVFACALTSAQETIHLARISGRVTDPSGATMDGAEVTARQTETGINQATITDREGRFRLTYLKVGPWEITVRQKGFNTSTRLVTATAGGAYELGFTLSVGTAETRVDVIANASLLETARSQIAGTVGQKEAENLPLNGRNFLELALLIPGVSPTNTGSNQLFAETSAVPGQGISVSSQRNFSNNFIVDGLSANDDAAGLSGVFYGLDTVREFQVVTSGGQAELGRALGGFLNIVTKSGTNTLHGDLYGFFRNQRFNASNPLSNTKLPFTQAQYGASLGGPVIKDRTFYFGNFEQRQLNQSGLITITPANVAAINARLDAVEFPGARIATGIYPNPVHLTNVLAKLDHQFGSRDQISVRYSLY
ncbi:MAG: carboxypeptidase regulatory-like domain-containing protein, partial [Bryobacteraceae bacterium]|nr:carboxypeptidase regulatory-like domain-containing protein [Bryobacteraceae bacterium]